MKWKGDLEECGFENLDVCVIFNAMLFWSLTENSKPMVDLCKRKDS